MIDYILLSNVLSVSEYSCTQLYTLILRVVLSIFSGTNFTTKISYEGLRITGDFILEYL